jgi:hydroxymethylpyrimidine pyrophosphatase-like HAD family hydrolase
VPVVRFRLVALDLDGTLLDPAGELRPAVRRAVRRVVASGVRVVVCTGRRLRTAQPYLEALGLPGPAVLQNGVVVKEARDGRTVHHRYLDASLYADALGALRELRERGELGPPLVYVDHYPLPLDIVSEPLDRAHPFQREYLGDNRRVTRYVDSLEPPPSHALVMVSCMAERERLLRARECVASAIGARVRTHLLANLSYRGHILEIVAAQAGKWPALRRLAASAGIAAAEILAVGDDENDVEMLREAGCGVAMGNAADSVRSAADRVTASNAEDGAARVLEELVPA